MKYLIISCILFVIQLNSLFSQVKVLEYLNQDSCNYRFYFHYVRDNENHDSFPDFYIDDKNLIHGFINDWRGEETNSEYLCWYDYFVYVTCNEKIVDLLKINYECKQVVTYKHIVNFDTHPFVNLTNDKNFNTFNYCTENLNDARTFAKKAKQTPGIFIPELDYYYWMDYDGYFYMQISIDSSMLDLRPSDFEKIIHDTYLDDKFYISFWGFGGGTMEAWVYCKKEFSDKFNLFRKAEWKLIDSYFSVSIFGDTEKIRELKDMAKSQLDK